MDQKQVMSLPYDVLEQLQFCGHFLHYRMGGCVGKRRILIVLLNYKEMLQRDLQDILDVQSGSLSEIIIKMEL